MSVCRRPTGDVLSSSRCSVYSVLLSFAPFSTNSTERPTFPSFFVLALLLLLFLLPTDSVTTVFQAPSELALSTRHNLWEEMLQAMGGEYAEMARLPPVGRWRELGVENRPCDCQP